MKNRIFIRILLVLEVLVAIAAAAALLICAWGGLSVELAAQWFNGVCAAAGGQVIVTVICAVVIIIGFVLMFARFSKKSPESHMLRECDYGSISVATIAIEEISRRYFNDIKEIRSVNLNVYAARGGIQIKASLALAPNVNIPELTANVQTGLKQYVETYIGIPVVKTIIVVFDTTMRAGK